MPQPSMKVVLVGSTLSSVESVTTFLRARGPKNHSRRVSLTMMVSEENTSALVRRTKPATPMVMRAPRERLAAEGSTSCTSTANAAMTKPTVMGVLRWV